MNGKERLTLERWFVFLDLRKFLDLVKMSEFWFEMSNFCEFIIVSKIFQISKFNPERAI